MARKTKTNTKTTRAKTVVEDNYVAPKRRKKADEPKMITLQEALAESGETIEDLTAPQPGDEAPTRPAGQSNLANTIRAHRSRYVVALHPNGKKTQNNGDEVATLLLPIPLATLKAFSATAFGVSYDHLNPGHARMCIGNRIRAAVKKGDERVYEWLLAQQPKQEAEEAATEDQAEEA